MKLLVYSLILAMCLPVFSPCRVSAQTWEPIGPNTGEVHDLFFSPHDPNTVYASGVLAPEYGNYTQLMASHDGGFSFTFLRSQQVVGGMAFHPTSADTLWMLEHNMYSRSVDGGLTWDDQSIPGSEYMMTDIARDYAADGALYMLNTTGSRSVLIRSLDEGDSWDEVYSEYGDPDQYLNGLYFRPGVSDTLYTIRSLPILFMEGKAVWRSIDGGSTWECMGSQLPGTPHWEMKPFLYFHPTDHSLILGMGEVFQGDFGIISRNSGLSFQLLTGPWGGSEWIRPFVLEDGTILLVTPTDLWMSEDAAETWSLALTDPGSFPLRMYSFLETDDFILTPYSPDHFYIAYEDIFLHTSDGGDTWSASIQGFSGTSALSIQTSRADANVVHAQTQGGVFRTEDRGENWSIVGLGEFITSNLSQANADYCVRWEFEHPWLSSDGCVTWIELEELSNTTSFAFHPTDSDIILTIANPQGSPPGVYRTEDGGETWALWGEFGHWSGTLFWDPLDTDRILLLNGSAVMLESRDGGQTFAEFGVGELLATYSMQPDGPGAVALGSSILPERGAHTTDRTDPAFPNRFSLPAEARHLDFAPDGWLISHQYDSAWISPDLGTNWWPIYQSGELPESHDRTLGVSADGTIYVAGGTQGVLMSTDALAVTDNMLAAATPQEFRLLPVYPNPFNGSAVISFDLPRPQTVTVTVFDVQGRSVAVLADHQTLGAGRNTVHWNAAGFASGPYFVHAAANHDRSIVSKVVLIK